MRDCLAGILELPRSSAVFAVGIVLAAHRMEAIAKLRHASELLRA
jgi:hypothetical protein